MANRIVKDSIRTSVNFNLLSVYAERHFYRLLTMTDDWGCFEATPSVVLGYCYPRQMKKINEEKISQWQQELSEKGLIGYWSDGERAWGKFLTFDLHNKCAIDDDGRQIRHRRRTPIEPQQLGTFQNILEHLRTLQNKYCNPNPNPNPNPNILSASPVCNDLHNIPFKEIIEDLNKKADRSYLVSDKTKGYISARWRDGFRLADFEYVHTVKCAEWCNTDMAKYLRPETLYSNKFEGYRNQPMPTKIDVDSWEHKMVSDFVKREPSI